MKDVIIGSVVAAVIVFVYQAMSWMVLPIHENSLKYTAQQDAIISALSANLNEDGMYAIPNPPPNSTQEEKEAFDNSKVGKPMAMVHYVKSYGGMMTSQLVCGFIINLIAAFVIAFVMWKAGDRFEKLTLAMMFVVFTILQSSLMQANWWGTPWHYLSGEITDHIIGWLLGGAWLAWWFRPKTNSIKTQ